MKSKRPFKLFSFFKKIFSLINRLLNMLVDWSALVSFVLLLIIMTFQVAARFLNIKAVWTEELAQIFFIYTIFLALPLVTKKKQLIYIKAISFFWSKKISPKIDVIGQLIWLFSLLFFAFICFQNLHTLYQFKSTTPVLGLNETLIRAVLPFSLLLTFHQAFIVLKNDLKK